ncbi:hypothetical protein BHE74_00027313 [Ensete ventricosum]|nr:hypothetical protein BHE74_00027313 [Ensete ventricosum]
MEENVEQSKSWSIDVFTLFQVTVDCSSTHHASAVHYKRLNRSSSPLRWFWFRPAVPPLQFHPHPSRKPVIRSTKFRTWLRSRPLSVLPCPVHSEKAASVLPRDARTCGGTSSVSRSSSPPCPPPHSSTTGAPRALGIATGADVVQVRARDELLHALCGSHGRRSWPSGHITSDSLNSSINHVPSAYCSIVGAGVLYRREDHVFLLVWMAAADARYLLLQLNTANDV